MKFNIAIVVGLCALCLTAGEVAASGFGVRAGLGIDPDQAVVGLQGQMNKKELAAFNLAPSLDFGFGDDVTTICGNLDFLLVLSPPDSRGGLYAGLGPTLTYWDFKNVKNDTEIGLSLVAGLRFGAGTGGNAYTGEVRFGIGDAPDVRILVGMLFGL